ELAIAGCTSLESIHLPEGITSIGRLAFNGCTNLKSIRLPEGITSIGELAIAGCTSLESIHLPDGITSIGEQAFEDCTSLKSIRLPDSLTSIGKRGFCNCSSLESIHLPAGITSIGEGTFLHCGNLESIDLPAGITSIGSMVFSCCDSLKSIHLPEGITSIGSLAFYKCSSLESIHLPAGITSIDERAFAACTSLKLIVITSLDETTKDRITKLLPEELQDKVVSKEIAKRILEIEKIQLERILCTPETSPLRRTAKSAKNMPFPEHLFKEINRRSTQDNRFYQMAQRQIDKLPYPDSRDDKGFDDYEAKVREVVTEVIERARGMHSKVASPSVSKNTLFKPDTQEPDAKEESSSSVPVRK
ncbi:MAG: leucine-rich repeat domain-containing protein, partial [Legionellaceae bacterium]|nr:leucine-rich repeat domain-containing protein [Legionellaceae bacterium]